MGLFGPSRKEIVKERYEEKAKHEAEERAKAEAASLASDAQGIMKKAKLNKEIKELEPQIETLNAEVERLSK